jgi:hypothetical protein
LCSQPPSLWISLPRAPDSADWLGRAIGLARDPDVLRKARAALAELTDREKK